MTQFDIIWCLNIMKQKLITDYFLNSNQKLITDYFSRTNLRKRKNLTCSTGLIGLTDLNGLTHSNDLPNLSIGNKKTKNIIKGYDPETDSWHCLMCGVDMGSSNPRQLCGKYRCMYEC